GTAAVEIRHGNGEDLDVISRCPGPLRDAGNRCALRNVARARRRLDEPFREHAAALPSERADQNGQRLLRCDHAGWSIASTALRMRAANRSRQFGFSMTSAR